METKLRRAKTILINERTERDITKSSMALAQKQIHWDPIKNPDIAPYTCRQLSFDKGARNTQ